MQSANRVVWTEGMFLRVQHFQQADRWTEALVHASVRDMQPHRWGFADLAVDRDLLNIGKFALSHCRGTMPDGTPFSMPDDTDPPPPLELTGGERGAMVYLALPLHQQGTSETGGDRREEAGTRYRRALYEAPDANAGSFASASLEIGRTRLSYLISGAPTAGYALLPAAVIVETRPDLAVILEEKFVAPCLNCAAQPMLSGFLAELQGLITHRAEAIAARMADPSVRGTAEVADFMLLQSMNRAEPLLRHLLEAAPTLHPEEFYRHMIVLAGELATYTAASKRAAVFPPYRHDALYATFAPVFADLRASLSSVLEQNAVMIPLQDRRHGVRVGMITDRSLLLNGTFVLSVHADVPAEQLRRAFPNQMKIGPVEQIAQLVNIALPGIPIRPLPVAPRQLPYRSGSVYFELERGGPVWKQLSSSGAIALHLAGSFPQIEMELWAIKD
jgi:type VI secretion system protein ImpJ